MGGLGNQLFQYAFAVYLVQELESHVVLDTSSIQRDRLRDYKLNNYTVRIPAASRIEMGISTLNAILCRKGINIKNTYVGQDAFHYIDAYRARKYYFFQGYFQNLKYVKAVAKKLKTDIKYNGTYSEIQKKLGLEIDSCNSVALHVRRGDYLKVPDVSVLSEKYYYDAIKAVKANLEKPKFYIFSDDIEWCRQNFGNRDGFHYIDNKYNNSDVVDFEMMRRCKNFIIGNSTFSWWACTLSRGERNICIAPKDWYTVADANTKCRAALLNGFCLI